MVQRSLVCVATALGLLALFATPVIGAEWDDSSPPKPQPGNHSSGTSSGGREPAQHGPPPSLRVHTVVATLSIERLRRLCRFRRTAFGLVIG